MTAVRSYEFRADYADDTVETFAVDARDMLAAFSLANVRKSEGATDVQLIAITDRDVVCSCPPNAKHPSECLGCLVCGPAAEKACEDEARSEQDAESAWLRAAEYDPRMSDPREW